MTGQAPLLEVRLLAESFAPLRELEAWQEQLALQLPSGLPAAESHFIGRVRGRSPNGSADGSCDGSAAGETAVEALELEHYPGMSEARILALAAEGADRHGVAAVLVVHRHGRLGPGEPIVLVAVAADRRGPAQRCTQELLEALKHEAPFWKREWRGGVGTWVQGNTPF